MRVAAGQLDTADAIAAVLECLCSITPVISDRELPGNLISMRAGRRVGARYFHGSAAGASLPLAIAFAIGPVPVVA